MAKFRVALSSDFRRPDGSPAFVDWDMAPLDDNPDIEVTYVDAIDNVMPAEGLAGHDALILLAKKFTAASVPADGRLAMVARFGVGFDNVDIPACNANGIAAVITPDGVRRPVAVSILTFMLALSQKMHIKERLTRQGPEGWKQISSNMGVGLMGRTFGSLGIGNIGAEAYRLIQPFGMRHIAHDPFADQKVAADLNIELVSIEDLFKQSDFLSVSCPLNDQTRGIVNAEKLAMMKPTAYVINTARGPIIDEPALVDALKSGTIAGAGLDVFEQEPCPADAPILQLDSVIVTPHSLCWTDQCFAGIGASDVKSVLAMMRGEIPGGIVNKDITSNSAWLEKLAGYKAAFGS